MYSQIIIALSYTSLGEEMKARKVSKHLGSYTNANRVKKIIEQNSRNGYGFRV